MPLTDFGLPYQPPQEFSARLHLEPRFRGVRVMDFLFRPACALASGGMFGEAALAFGTSDIVALAWSLAGICIAFVPELLRRVLKVWNEEAPGSGTHPRAKSRANHKAPAKRGEDWEAKAKQAAKELQEEKENSRFLASEVTRLKKQQAQRDAQN